MASRPPWIAKLLGRGSAASDTPAPQPLRTGTVVLKPKQAPKPHGREITLKPNGDLAQPVPASASAPGRTAPHIKQITPAAMIYAVAAGILFTLAIYNMFHGSIFNGIVTLLPAGGLAVLAYKYIQ